MIVFRICNVLAGDTQPEVQPRAFYKAFLQHVNRRNEKSRVRISTRYFIDNRGKHIVVKTAYILPVDGNFSVHSFKKAA